MIFEYNIMLWCLYEKQNTLAYVIKKNSLSRKTNVFFLMFLEMIYQSNKMTDWEICVIYKNNQCFTSFHAYTAKCNKDIAETKKKIKH